MLNEGSTNSPQYLSLFSDFEYTTPLVRRFWLGRRSMNPRTAPPDSGAIEEKPRLHGHTPGPALIPMSTQKTIFVILSAAKNLSFKAAEIRNEAALRSE